MRPVRLAALLLTSRLRLAAADVKFTSPTAGEVLPGGGVINIAWVDSGVAPDMTELTSYQIFLCAGGNEVGTTEQWLVIAKGSFAAGNQAQGSFASSIGSSMPANAYFFKIISVGKSGGTITNFSPRFTLTGMTGTFPQNVLVGMQSVSGTNGPPTENNLVSPITVSASEHTTSTEFQLPPTLQTGLIVYAPMQAYPRSKITKRSKTPLYPSSPYTIATMPMPPPRATKTVTASPDWSFAQRENPVSAAARPEDDWGKYLFRWRD